MGLTSFEIFGFPPIKYQMEDDGQLILHGYMVFVTNPIGYIAYIGSILSALFLTIERYCAICQQTSISLKKTKMISFAIILISAILASPTWFKYKWETKEFASGNYIQGNKTETWGSSEFFTYYNQALRIFIFVIPLTFFLIFNLLIMKKVGSKNNLILLY